MVAEVINLRRVRMTRKLSRRGREPLDAELAHRYAALEERLLRINRLLTELRAYAVAEEIRRYTPDVR